MYCNYQISIKIVPSFYGSLKMTENTKSSGIQPILKSIQIQPTTINSNSAHIRISCLHKMQLTISVWCYHNHMIMQNEQHNLKMYIFDKDIFSLYISQVDYGSKKGCGTSSAS